MAGTVAGWRTQFALAGGAVTAVIVSLLTSGRVAAGAALVAAVVAAFTLGRFIGAPTEPAPIHVHHGRIEHLLGVSLARCRRFDRPLTILRLEGVVDPATRRVLADQVRLTDEVCHAADGTYVLMPEESEIGAVAWIRRLRRTLDLPPVGVAQFPVDGLTVDALLAKVRAEDARLSPADVPPQPVPEAEAQPADRSAS